MSQASIDPAAPLILVVEDDKSMRILLRQAMEQEGYRVEEVADGEQGLVLYTRLQPDLVIIDAFTPVITQLRALAASDRLPIVMLAASADKELVARAFAAGVTDYLPKPFHWDLLRQRVRYLLQQAQSYKQLEQSHQQLQAELGELQQQQRALSASQERFALIAASASDGLWDWNLFTNEVYFSPRWKSLLGYEENEIDNSIEAWFSRVHPDDIEQVKAAIAKHLQGLTVYLENEHRLLDKHGQYRWMRCRGLAVPDVDARAYRITGSQTDITEHKGIETELWRQAMYDSLTNLPNRTLFLQRVDEALQKVRQQDYLFAVMFLDLDRFKVVNDSLGYLLGDQVLIAVGQRIARCLHSGDTVARLGGDEFAILVKGLTGVADARQIAECIQQSLIQPFLLSRHEVFTSGSIGIALSNSNYNQPEDILRDAEVTMYHARARGKGRYDVFDPVIHAQAMARLQLETDLQQALARQELQLYYQPIMSLKHGHLSGFEALLRWQHPQQGMISPAEFIPIAEEAGLIVPIGWWVLETACRQMYTWQCQFATKQPLKISVNLSAKQLAQPDLIGQIDRILQSTQLAPQSLKLEITESILIDSAESTTKILQQLRTLGIQLSMDDFGTGYSSLSYLHRLPIDTLKIDRSFTKDIDCDAEKIEIIRTVVSLAWNLGLDVVAEGVETKKQMYQLRGLRCDFGQGYFFSRPLDAEMAQTLILKEISTGLEETPSPCGAVMSDR